MCSVCLRSLFNGYRQTPFLKAHLASQHPQGCSTLAQPLWETLYSVSPAQSCHMLPTIMKSPGRHAIRKEVIGSDTSQVHLAMRVVSYSAHQLDHLASQGLILTFIRKRMALQSCRECLQLALWTIHLNQAYFNGKERTVCNRQCEGFKKHLLLCMCVSFHAMMCCGGQRTTFQSPFSSSALQVPAI